MFFLYKLINLYIQILNYHIIVIYIFFKQYRIYKIYTTLNFNHMNVHEKGYKSFKFKFKYL